MKKEATQLYDSIAEDYYLKIGNNQLYFKELYEELNQISFDENEEVYYITELKLESIICSINCFKILLDDEIFVYKPKTIIINGYKRKCYNLEQCQAFLEEHKIDIDKLIYKKKPIKIGQIIPSDKEIIELEVKSKPIKEKDYQIYLKKKNIKYLSDLVGKNKNYVNFNKESKYFRTKKRNELKDFIIKIFFQIKI